MVITAKSCHAFGQTSKVLPSEGLSRSLKITGPRGPCSEALQCTVYRLVNAQAYPSLHMMFTFVISRTIQELGPNNTIHPSIHPSIHPLIHYKATCTHEARNLAVDVPGPSSPAACPRNNLPRSASKRTSDCSYVPITGPQKTNIRILIWYIAWYIIIHNSMVHDCMV